MESALYELSEWARNLSLDDVPDATRRLVCLQLLSTVANVRQTAGTSVGKNLLSASGGIDTSKPEQTAYAMSALNTAFDMDDVAYVGHLSASVIPVAVAEAFAGRLDGHALVEAVVAANECASRLTSSTILGPFFRNQTNVHTHLMGTAVARLRARSSSASEWLNALSLAMSIIPTPVHEAVIMGEIRPFVAADSVLLALKACDAAEAGFAGSARVLEAPEGLLSQMAAVPLTDWITAGTGKLWHTDTLTFKRFPGSVYLQSAFDCAERLHREFGYNRSSCIDAIEIQASILTWLLDQKTDRASRDSRPGWVAATLSAGYGVATILLDGKLSVSDFSATNLNDTRRSEVAGMVTVKHDIDLSKAMLHATAPLGESLRRAGERALDWPEFALWAGDEAPLVLQELGPPAETFADATMAIGARLTVHESNGAERLESTNASFGACGFYTEHGEDSRDRVVSSKLETSGVPKPLAREAYNLARLKSDELRSLLSDLLFGNDSELYGVGPR